MNLFLSIYVAFMLLNPQQQGVPYSAIDTAFDQKNAEAVVNFAREKVLINVLGKEGAYSKSQAVLVLKDFFANKSNTNFNFTFKGNESSSGAFAIGSYTSSAGKFRVTIHFKNAGDDFKIESITIEKD
jgi:hypothetical protein